MKIGSLFNGYGGLDMAIKGDLSWYSEIEQAACTVMQKHYPQSTNIGDMTEVNWSEIQQVDVLTGGYPCQPFSTAGKRKGKNDERHLWPYVQEAISVLEPRIAILENVAGHLTLGLGTVIGQLSELGYATKWATVRASDAGAPHQRKRVFIVAYPASAEWGDKESDNLVQTGWGTSESRECHSTYPWGTYEKAIRRWEKVLGRPAPQAWEEKYINPAFVEWMMGLPEGWVTGHGLTRSEELKMLGNGVVPQQASLALKVLGSMS